MKVPRDVVVACAISQEQAEGQRAMRVVEPDLSEKTGMSVRSRRMRQAHATRQRWWGGGGVQTDLLFR
jgi:hypothetical protein